ncbi:MAG TPA: FkbM family methyltransferase [Candidatus Angelobacter sp.]|nr:FkbM family methyltransferase [Candidatus Angelobacter sp.]
MLWLYRRIIPRDFLAGIGDFDGDMILDVDVRGAVGISLWHFPDLYEKEEREVFCASIKPGCTVLDIGANIGFYTLLAAKRGARVFSVEADPLNVAMLRHHVEINGFSDRVTIFEMAATEREKAVLLCRHPFNMGESNIIQMGKPSGMIEGRTIDSLNLPPIDICKIDIEGAEFMALMGMQRTLERSRSIKLLVEYAERFGNCESLLAFLRANFRSVRVLESGQMRSPDEIPPFCNLLAVR